ncbi:EsaB/YukD family protein [Guptibacillus hwajinpoensis]|uniref:Ubiquitin n=1 Tax=Guptibacillus hwajinpoensis TaxID=208199 RepID=A0A0J6CVQ4_9BACL|nr:EsaB/YukD family protein [Alkalihalobacillus macyae]KMM37260.1 ubiquitin [Alkalihalobacillus macyae]MDP4551075.1 EsaB/YukD family protein [Alkalihalobacillus macyae]
MYIEVTIDLGRYKKDHFIDLRLSNYHSVKKLIEIVCQTEEINTPPNPNQWIRIVNKHKIVAANERLIEAGIMTGDRIEIL